MVPTDYLETIGNEEQRRLIEEFVSDMEGFFGVRRRTLSLELEWVESAPEEAQGLGLMEFMKDVSGSTWTLRLSRCLTSDLTRLAGTRSGTMTSTAWMAFEQSMRRSLARSRT